MQHFQWLLLKQILGQPTQKRLKAAADSKVGTTLSEKPRPSCLEEKSINLFFEMSTFCLLKNWKFSKQSLFTKLFLTDPLFMQRPPRLRIPPRYKDAGIQR